MKKTAQEVMSKELITVPMATPVVEAYSLMKKKNIRHLPVVDESQKIVGMISDRDIQRCIRYDRHSQSRLLDVELNLDPEIKVFEIMTWPVETIVASTAIRDVALTMLNSKFSSMIVECEDSARRGIITTDDLLKLLISLLDKDPSRLRLSVGGVVYDQPSGSPN